MLTPARPLRPRAPSDLPLVLNSGRSRLVPILRPEQCLSLSLSRTSAVEPAYPIFPGCSATSIARNKSSRHAAELPPPLICLQQQGRSNKRHGSPGRREAQAPPARARPRRSRVFGRLLPQPDRLEQCEPRRNWAGSAKLRLGRRDGRRDGPRRGDVSQPADEVRLAEQAAKLV